MFLLFIEHFPGELASSKWRLKFAKRGEPALGTTDITGSYCAMPDDWMKKKLAAAAVRPTNDALMKGSILSRIFYLIV